MLEAKSIFLFYNIRFAARILELQLKLESKLERGPEIIMEVIEDKIS